MKNKKLLKTVLCITSGIGFATSIPFTTTACGSSKPIPVDKKILPYEVYDINETTGVLNGFKSGIDLSQYDGICDTMQIPASVTSIAQNAFFNGSSQQATIPTFITKLIFADGSNCSSIGQAAFALCSSIKDIKIDNNYFHDEQLGAKGKAVITGKRGQISWNDSSVAVGSLACGDILIPDNITSIATNAFQYCSSISSIVLPNSLEAIGDSAFNGCSSLKSIDLSKCTNLSSIGPYAFEFCTNLTTINLPDSLETIGEGIFRNCKNLTLSTLPSNIKEIPKEAFCLCNSIRSMNLPTGLTKINESAFYYCRLQHVNFWNLSSLETIGNGAFTSSLLNSIDLSRCTNLSVINDNAFNNCVLNKIIILPNNLKSIGYAAFGAQIMLKSIFLPGGLETIGNAAFMSSGPGLETIVWKRLNNEPTIGENAFAVASGSIQSAGVVYSTGTYGNDEQLINLLKSKGLPDAWKSVH